MKRPQPGGLVGALGRLACSRHVETQGITSLTNYLTPTIIGSKRMTDVMDEWCTMNSVLIKY